jgi:hypothetical protein
MTEAAETWVGEQTPEALDLFNPIYVPMIVEPRLWTSLSEGNGARQLRRSRLRR